MVIEIIEDNPIKPKKWQARIKITQIPAKIDVLIQFKYKTEYKNMSLTNI